MKTADALSWTLANPNPQRYAKPTIYVHYVCLSVQWRIQDLVRQVLGVRLAPRVTGTKSVFDIFSRNTALEVSYGIVNKILDIEQTTNLKSKHITNAILNRKLKVSLE